MKQIIGLMIIALVTLFNSKGYSQGCSDAGFCTISNFKPDGTDSSRVERNQFKIGVNLGNADHSISAIGAYVEYNRVFNEKLGLDFKLTSLSQTGNDISVFGVSDLFVNANYNVNENLKVILGAKIPLSLADRKQNELPLPMDYQASLGTFDLIVGVGYKIKKLALVAAIQQPLTQNKNQFISTNYPVESELRMFQSTNSFKRNGDVLLRVSYPVQLTSQLKLTPSLLPIYHLGNDTFTDEFNLEHEITGSEGLTLNGNLYLDYAFKNKSGLQLNVGFPFIVRASRPDGLTRSFIANLEYKVVF